jgi:hypothetical protein
MLKSSSISRRNSAHLIGRKKTFEKNKNYTLSKFECFEHVKIFFNLYQALSI